jgi:hypothetical protein
MKTTCCLSFQDLYYSFDTCNPAEKGRAMGLGQVGLIFWRLAFIFLARKIRGKIQNYTNFTHRKCINGYKQALWDYSL